MITFPGFCKISVLCLCCLNVSGVLAASTITVETTAMEVSDANPFGLDNGQCSLDEAFVGFGGSGASDCVPQVNGDVSPLVIELQAVVYSLSRELRQISDMAGDTIEIRGNGATIERSDTATEVFRLIQASTSSPDISLKISNLTLRNAETTETGAALNVHGFNLVLTGVTFKNNYSTGLDIGTGLGGALVVTGSNINMQQCRFEGNTADRIAGAVYFNGVSGTISDTTFVNNNSSSVGALFTSNGNLMIVKSEFIGNSASGSVGAIEAQSQDNSENDPAKIGLSIIASIFRDNTAGIFAGAIRSTANPTHIRNSLFQGNQANQGGAIVRGLPFATSFTISNSTFSENSGVLGGAIAVLHGNITLQNDTIVGNHASSGGAGIWVDDTATASASVDHSIIHSNTSSTGIADCAGDSRSGGGYSILGFCQLPASSSDISASSVPLEDMLSLLANNGGGTKTFEPKEGGVAHNRGNREYPAVIPFDQRGFPRIAEGRVDIGAHERSAEKVIGMFDVIFNHSMESEEPLRFFDREEFLANTNADDATGALPALGNQDTNSNPIDVGTLTFVRFLPSSFFFGQFSDAIPDLPDAGDTVDLALNNLEQFDLQSSFPIIAFGFDFVDPDGDGTKFNLLACASIFDPSNDYCPQNDIVFSFDFSSNNTDRRFFGFKVSEPFVQVSIREQTNVNTNEYFGHFYTTPLP